ncbi:hypothetical protein KAU11_03045 [Candidatus Babeliales bacterium]|nr:hypothetical protein [Candidatus Babeliales bacterium]
MDFRIFVFVLSVVPNCIFSGIKSHNPLSALSFATGTEFTVDLGISSFDGRFNKLGTSIFSGDGQIGFAGGYLYGDDGLAQLVGTRDTDGSFILGGSQSAVVGRNSTFSALKARGSGNSVSGAARFSGSITLQDAATSLNVELYGTLNKNIVLNNGAISLNNDLVFADDYQMTGSGICYLQDRSVIFGASNLSFANTVSWIGEGIVELNGDVTLTGTWVFQGNATVRGNGNRIILDPDGSLIVWHNSIATFDNVIFDGLAQSSGSVGTFNLRCLDNDSKLLLRNSKLILDKDYSFTVGTIDVERTVEIIGASYTFTHASILDFAIKSKSRLTIGRDTWFSYASIAGTNNHLTMQDDTSELFLDGCTLHATDVGLRLETGKMTVKDRVYLRSDASVAVDAIEFDSAMEVRILPGATLDVKGILVYD